MKEGPLKTSSGASVRQFVALPTNTMNQFEPVTVNLSVWVDGDTEGCNHHFRYESLLVTGLLDFLIR